MKSNLSISQNNWLRNSDLFIIIIFCCVPLFMSFPYRVNIFLSWEGAYRLYLGQVPYRDFGLPMGFGYWVVPAIFFKVFGPYLISLIKAQVFLNFICCLSFRGILKKLKLSDGVRIAVMIIFCLSYILPNFWPWYNNSVIIWQIVGLNFLLGFLNTEARKKYVFLFLSCFFLFVSFFTKQDGGFLGFAIAAALVLYNTIITKKWKDIFLFLLLYIIIAVLVILPFTQYSFGYWFNHGQPPHTARISISEILGELFSASQWIKFYFLLIAIIVAFKIKNNRSFLTNRNEMIFLLLTLGILAEALIFGVTSYTPPDNNIFFHSFALAYIITGLSGITLINFSKVYYFLGLTILILFWWSAGYWQYINRIAMRIFPSETVEAKNDSLPAENVINRYTYMLNLDSNYYEDESTWTTIDSLKSFQKIYLPPSTIAGIQRLKKMDVLKNNNASVLNMTELTPLDYEFGYKLETGQDHPLWDHLGVCMFNKQCDDYCNKIKNKQYDVVLFEYIPSLNNFFPFRIRDSLQVYYKKTDSFLAPRRPTNGTIEVYVK
ncbi:hypothetical protein [Parafilimonas terrae]|uniref:Dolichyl-phosphate-mannose-protein mannosyltransferase n=1 Tax=Parafilimonas terrae TaxID=1465490 RepID=A0A1I5UHP7_9BACT|nr:hypothetical protein [Parafilimonas terrae]SFP94719.1 hypothetical protein SAMN05444277_103298 [Parafilimonas terrae]